MTPVETCQIVTTTSPLTSGVPTIHMAHSPMWSTRAMDVNVLTMGWNCRKVCIATIQWTRQASMRMPATSKSTVPAVQHGIRCLVLHGLNTALLRRIGATRCTIGASCLGASWEVAAQRELQLRCLQGRRRHSSATTRVCQRRIAAPPLMTCGVRLIRILFRGRREPSVWIVGQTCVSAYTKVESYQVTSSHNIHCSSQGNLLPCPMWLCMARLVPHGIPCLAPLLHTVANQVLTGRAVTRTGVSCLGVMCQRAASPATHLLCSMARSWLTTATMLVGMLQTATMILRRIPAVHLILTSLEGIHCTRDKAVSASMQAESCPRICC